MSVSVKGFGSKVVYVRGFVASWATQPENFVAGEDILGMCEESKFPRLFFGCAALYSAIESSRVIDFVGSCGEPRYRGEA